MRFLPVGLFLPCDLQPKNKQTCGWGFSSRLSFDPGTQQRRWKKAETDTWPGDVSATLSCRGGSLSPPGRKDATGGIGRGEGSPSAWSGVVVTWAPAGLPNCHFWEVNMAQEYWPQINKSNTKCILVSSPAWHEKWPEKERAEHFQAREQPEGEGVGQRAALQRPPQTLVLTWAANCITRHHSPAADRLSGLGPVHWDFWKLFCHSNVQPKLKASTLKTKSKNTGISHHPQMPFPRRQEG